MEREILVYVRLNLLVLIFSLSYVLAISKDVVDDKACSGHYATVAFCLLYLLPALLMTFIREIQRGVVYIIMFSNLFFVSLWALFQYQSFRETCSSYLSENYYELYVAVSILYFLLSVIFGMLILWILIISIISSCMETEEIPV